MQSPLVCLLMIGAVWSAPAPADDAAVADFERLSLSARQQFLHTLLVDRFETAANIALPVEEKVTQSQRYGRVLERVAAGKSLSASGLQKLLDEVASVEKSAIEQLSLRYRVQVYTRFRTQRAEYDRRMSIWRKLLSGWEASQKKISEGPLVISWLVTSLDRMRYDESAVLPALPSWGGAQPPKVATRTPPQADFSNSLPSPAPVRTGASRQSTSRIPIKPPVAVVKPQVPSKPLVHIADEPRLAHRVEKPALPEIGTPPRVVIRDVQPVVAPPETLMFDEEDEIVSEPRVRVDINELTVRVHAYNFAIKELAGNLQDESAWDNRQVAQSLGALSELADRRTQLALYRDLISADEQKQVGELLSLDAAIALLGAKIYAARERLTDAEAPEASELDGFSRRLAQLAAKRAR